MKKILVGMFAAVALFSSSLAMFATLALYSSSLARAEQNKYHQAPPEGLEAADAVELVLGAVDSAPIRDKVGVSRWGFGLKGVTTKRYYSDKSVTYRNGVWIVQPLPLRETSEPAPPLTVLLLCIIGFAAMNWWRKRRGRDF